VKQERVKAAGTIKGAITSVFIPASRRPYTIDESVFIPSFMCLSTDGYVYMNYPSATGSAFSINNASLDISSGGMSSNPADVQGCKVFNANGVGLFLPAREGMHLLVPVFTSATPIPAFSPFAI
jgi:hypothetical protein